MLFLKNDYSQGAHPEVLEALVQTNLAYADGYGLDPYCVRAADLIRMRTGAPDADVHFLPGGTLMNLTAIAAFLRPHEAVIAPESGHICVHETGAIEATGHKVIHVPSADGKLRPEQIHEVMVFHEDEHYVKPRMIYISDSTETGLIYTKGELAALKAACEAHGLLVYLDGARLAMALTAPGNDLAMTDLPGLTDAFYLGGTKCGLLFGEALVLCNDALKEDFRFLIKQRGGLLAKSRLMGVQFAALLEGDLYFRNGAHANRMAARLAEAGQSEGSGQSEVLPANSRTAPCATGRSSDSSRN